MSYKSKIGDKQLSNRGIGDRGIGNRGIRDSMGLSGKRSRALLALKEKSEGFKWPEDFYNEVIKDWLKDELYRFLFTGFALHEDNNKARLKRNFQEYVRSNPQDAKIEEKYTSTGSFESKVKILRRIDFVPIERDEDQEVFKVQLGTMEEHVKLTLKLYKNMYKELTEEGRTIFRSIPNYKVRKEIVGHAEKAEGGLKSSLLRVFEYIALVFVVYSERYTGPTPKLPSGFYRLFPLRSVRLIEQIRPFLGYLARRENFPSYR